MTRSRTGADCSAEPATKQAPTTARAPSKLDLMLALLGRPAGATLAELVAATGWQAHSVRGALAGALRRNGHAITAETVDGIRRYRLGGVA